MKVCVEKQRKMVKILDFGQAPFAIERTKRGTAYIPDNFVVETKGCGHLWIAKTRVLDGIAEYCFSLKDDALRSTSDWLRSPTAAFRQANEKLRNLRYRTGTNGAVFIGITYTSIQKLIQERFSMDLAAMGYVPEFFTTNCGENAEERFEKRATKRIRMFEEPEQESPKPQDLSEDFSPMEAFDECLCMDYATLFFD